MYHVFGSQNQIIIINLYPAILMAPLLMQFLISSSSLSSIIGVMFYNPYQQIMAEIITITPSQGNTTTITTSSPFLTYENPTYRIRIQYPSDWEKLEFSQRNIVVIFRSPRENSSDTKLENLLIQVGNLPSQNIPLDEIVRANINKLKQSLIDFELIELNATTLSGNNPAHKVVYTNREGEDELKTMQVVSIKEDKVYLITYTAEASRYDRYLPTIQKMIDSFRLGDSGIIGV
jgi:eukaryotic-like serine/threonine-protein kinase